MKKEEMDINIGKILTSVADGLDDIGMVKEASVVDGLTEKIRTRRERSTIEQMKELAESRGGKCLSNEYVDNNTKLLWQCEKEHQWEATPHSIKNGSWCPYCAGKHKTIDDMKRMAELKGGKCLSDKYISMHTKLLWQCENGHKWEATSNSIKRGTWCPYCSLFVKELISRNYIEKIMNIEFPKSYPLWLKTKDCNKLELDGYNQDLKIAIEYQGEQHYNASHIDKRNPDKFWKRLEYDNLKKKLCKKNGVLLIEIPYEIKSEDIGKYLYYELKKYNKPVYMNYEDVEKLDYRKFDIYDKNKIKEMKNVAKSRGGQCLSDKYIDARTKLLWQCEKGHKWDATPSNIKSGYWCPYCYGRIRGNIEDMKELALSKGGKCLSDEYINGNTKLLWQCEKGHQWEAIPHHIKKGSWCPYCSGTVRGTIEEMKQIAESRGGKCLSSEYINAYTKLLWQCEKGHQWEAVPGAVKHGTWCPDCAGNLGDNIENMKELALSKGGKCLSNEYINAQTKLLWQCEKEHRWEANPNSIKQGSWCPYCAGNIRKSIEDMKELALSKGGKCLSDKYINTCTKLLWQCEKDHKWEATHDNVKQGRWCPYCAGNKKDKIISVV